MVQQPIVNQGHLNVQASQSHSQTHHCRWDSSGPLTKPTQKPISDNTRHSQKINKRVPGGIRTQHPSKRAVPYPGFRPYGHRDRSKRIILYIISSNPCISENMVKTLKTGLNNIHKFMYTAQWTLSFLVIKQKVNKELTIIKTVQSKEIGRKLCEQNFDCVEPTVIATL